MTKPLSVEVSNKIRNMSFICALLVVSIHIPWDTSPFSCSWILFHFLKEGVARIAVPFFFIVSGYFLGRHFDNPSWWKTACAKRVNTLLLPYVCWVVLYAFWAIPLAFAANALSARPLLTNISINLPPFQKWFGLDIFHPPMLFPLWYVRMLMLLVVISPLFKWLLNKFTTAVMTISFLWAATWTFFPVSRELFDMGVSPFGVFYWMFGLCLAMGKVQKPPRIPCAISTTIGVCLLILRAWCDYNGSQLEPPVRTICIPFILYSVWQTVPDKKWKSWITSTSFPIYVMHPCWFTWVWTLGRNITGLPKCIIMLLTGILAPIAFTLTIRKFTPRVAKLLFGGR